MMLVLYRTREADLGKRVEEHHRVGAEHERRMAALAEETRLLRTQAEESRRGLEPHATYALLQQMHFIKCTI